MVDFIRIHQLDFMLVLIGVSMMLILMLLVTRAIQRNRKIILLCMAVCALFLLIADRHAYFFRGNPSRLGFWMVRISNFIVFFLQIMLLRAFNFYLINLFTHEGKLEKKPTRLRIAEAFVWIGVGLLIISQFTDLYYTFDNINRYHRARFFPLSYLCPMIITFLQFSAILKYYKRINKLIGISLLIFTTMPIIATILQIFAYGLSLTNMAAVGEVTLLYLFVLIDLNKSADRANKMEIQFLKEEHSNTRIMFEQTATALANAIDAKDKYTHGHSTRVAEYARKIAEMAGKNTKYCNEIYFAGLLHDVGKIGIPSSIINKDGKLTDIEYAAIQNHPTIGKQILSGISKSPYLSIAANYHHERYDGHGYPEGLKGIDIPEIARIIAVADAYDAMTSKRSYRDPIPQQKVREEIVKGIGTQFDPQFAKIMLHLIDMDTEYLMKEHSEVKELAGKNELNCGEYKTAYSEGILIDRCITTIRLHFKADDKFVSDRTVPTLILFDSLDARIHNTEKNIKAMNYYEYGEIRLNGKANCPDVRKIQIELQEEESTPVPDWNTVYKHGLDYEIQAVKVVDHVLITIQNLFQTVTATIALNDSGKYLYIGLTGEHCFINKVNISKTLMPVPKSYIPRIAEEIKYIDLPDGDVPNIIVDSWCSEGSKGIPVEEGNMQLSFHSKSLPNSRLIWHCPYLNLFYSDDATMTGDNYKIYELVRLDGETWESNHAENKFIVNKTENFNGWDVWKAENKKGIDCTVNIQRNGNIITINTENLGIAIKSITTLPDNTKDVFICLTGDQCAIANIKSQKI